MPASVSAMRLFTLLARPPPFRPILSHLGRSTSPISPFRPTISPCLAFPLPTPAFPHSDRLPFRPTPFPTDSHSDRSLSSRPSPIPAGPSPPRGWTQKKLVDIALPCGTSPSQPRGVVLDSGPVLRAYVLVFGNTVGQIAQCVQGSVQRFAKGRNDCRTDNGARAER